MIKITTLSSPTRELKILSDRQVEALKIVLELAELTGEVRIKKFSIQRTATCWELLDSDRKAIFTSPYLTDAASMLVNLESVRDIIETLDPPYIETPTCEYTAI